MTFLQSTASDPKREFHGESIVKKWLACSVQPSSYGCTWEVCQAPDKLESHSQANHFFYNIKTFKHLSSRVEIFIEIRSSYMKQIKN